MDDRQRLKAAQNRVAQIKGFYIHLFAFAAVFLVLLVLNVLSDGSWWVHWVLGGWGIGIIAHALAVFWKKPAFIAEWERRKLRQSIGR
jgi:hypothetical protein